MQSIDRVIRSTGYFLRRRDLLALGYTDVNIRGSLEVGAIFRVRHGWYSVPDAPDAAVLAVRVGGRLTGTSALESYGLRVPRRQLTITVPPTASRLRNPVDRRVRRGGRDRVTVLWNDSPLSGGNRWRVSIDEALLAVLTHESRDIAVACASAALRFRKLSPARLTAVFRRAPQRAWAWHSLVSALDDSHGETLYRLWTGDVGLDCEQQPHISGVGQLDFRMGPHTYVEIDGGQHDPEWTGGSPSTYEADHDRDTTMAIEGDRVLRFTYRQLYTDWPRVLAATERAIADGQALAARRARHPYRPRANRKRRRSSPKVPIAAP